LWTLATQDGLSDVDQRAFVRLMMHEYVEARLMRSGLPYRAPNPAAWETLAPGEYLNRPVAEHFGAHDLAPLVAPERSPFEHWRTLFQMPVSVEQARRLGVPIEDWMGVTLPSEREAARARGAPTAVPATQPAHPVELRVLALNLVRQLRATNTPVIVNIGGTGDPHEPASAINLNPNLVAPRIGIPNQVAAPAEVIGSLFEAQSVDRIEGHNLPPTGLDWNQVAPGAFRVLRPGGTFDIYFRGAHPAACLGLPITMPAVHLWPDFATTEYDRRIKV
jgi:hypothetical protein